MHSLMSAFWSTCNEGKEWREDFAALFRGCELGGCLEREFTTFGRGRGEVESGLSGEVGVEWEGVEGLCGGIQTSGTHRTP